MTNDDIGTVKLYRNLKTGKKFLFIKEENDDYITAELNESEKVISASNRTSKYGVQNILYDYDMEKDHNTGLTYDSSKGFTKIQKRDDNLDDQTQILDGLNVAVYVNWSCMTSVPFTSLQPRCLLSFRKRSVDVLDVLEEWIMVNGKPTKIMHDNGKQFTSSIFKRFLEHNNTKDKPFPKSCKEK